VFNEHFDKQCILVCSLTRIRSATTWKPGSTLLVIFPKWTPYVVARHKDELGRWCSITLQVKDNRKLVVYSFYNCCKTKIKQAGIHTIFAQHWHVLRQRGDLDPDPRLASVCAAYDLVDVMDYIHPEDSDIPSYARSSNRLDYVIVSNTLLPDRSSHSRPQQAPLCPSSGHPLH
jgi:hypothetical protein